MKTLDQLQLILNAPEVEYRSDCFFKDLAPIVECADGYSLSVQASEYHYCTPRRNSGPYTHVEVWHCGSPEILDEYGNGDDPYAYVPIEIVAELIDNHGGFLKD